MADENQTSIVIPDAMREKHPKLIELILASESMNDEERQYWVNILPVMTPEQVDNLSQILANEKKQLAAIDSKYNEEMDRLNKGKKIEDMQKDRQEKKKERSDKEKVHQEKEDEKEQEILNAIADL